ncbi:MAG: hypothetical protein H7195_10845 [Chryseobacterium sp.]|nr:hypothetical protein [Chryseobacterium sp.]
MKIKLNYYGKLVEITKKPFEMIDIEEPSVSSIKNHLGKTYLEMLNMTYQIAENSKILKEKDNILKQELDVFPPFSGG